MFQNKILLRRLLLLQLCLVLGIAGGCRKSPPPLQFVTTFKEHHPLSSAATIAQRTRMPRHVAGTNDYAYDITEQSFAVHIPGDYKPDKSYGILIWLPHNEQPPELPQEWNRILAKYRLITVTAVTLPKTDKSNPFQFLIPMALDAVHNIQQQYNIDTQRVYIAGYSAAAIAASLTAFHYPDVFSGGLFVGDAGAWETVTKRGLKGDVKVYPAAFRPPELRHLYHIQRKGRYVIMTGSTASNRNKLKNLHRHFFRNKLQHCFYLEFSGMDNNNMPSAHQLSKSLDKLQ